MIYLEAISLNKLIDLLLNLLIYTIYGILCQRICTVLQINDVDHTHIIDMTNLHALACDIIK